VKAVVFSEAGEVLARDEEREPSPAASRRLLSHESGTPDGSTGPMLASAEGGGIRTHEAPGRGLPVFDRESVLDHAEALGLPVERCFEVETDLSP
jgi:hypothetical protein